MLDVVWLIPAFPLAGFLLILLVRPPPRRPMAGFLATAMVGASFVVAVGVYFDLLSIGRRARRTSSTLFTWLPVGALARRPGVPRRPAVSITMCLFVTGVGALIHLYADRVHARRPEVLQVLPLPQPVRLLDADARARREPARHVPRLGGRRHLLVLPDLVLAHRAARPRPARRRSSPTASATRASCSPCSSPSQAVGSLSYAASTARRAGTLAPVDGHRRSRCCCSSAPSARAPSSRCTSGCPTRWRARRRCRR